MCVYILTWQEGTMIAETCVCDPWWFICVSALLYDLWECSCMHLFLPTDTYECLYSSVIYVNVYVPLRIYGAVCPSMIYRPVYVPVIYRNLYVCLLSVDIHVCTCDL